MNKGSLVVEKERQILNSMLNGTPVDRMAATLARALFQLYGTNLSETILLDALSRIQTGDI